MLPSQPATVHWKVASFCAVLRACLEPVGRSLWREGKMGEGRKKRREGGREVGGNKEGKRGIGEGRSSRHCGTNRRREM